MLIDRASFFILYDSLYYFTVLLVLLSVISVEITKDDGRQQKLGAILVLIPLLTLIPLVGFRKYNVGTDTSNYYNYLWLIDKDIDFSSDFIFTIIVGSLKYFNLSYSVFLLLISFIFFYSIYYSLKIISKFYHSNIFFLFFTYFSFFFFLSLSINVIRQGVSLALLLLAYSYLLNSSNRVKTTIFLLISLGLHLTSIIPISLFILAYKSIKYIKIKYFYLLFLLAIVASYMNIGLADISPFLIDILGDDKRVSYLDGNDSDYKTGFRLQFAIFNSFFLLAALSIKTKIRNDIWLLKYEILIRYYILASSIFFMAFQLPYSDRWGLFSWFVIPLFFAPLFASRYIKPSIRIHWIILLIIIFVGFRYYV